MEEHVRVEPQLSSALRVHRESPVLFVVAFSWQLSSEEFGHDEFVISHFRRVLSEFIAASFALGRHGAACSCSNLHHMYTSGLIEQHNISGYLYRTWRSTLPTLTLYNTAPLTRC